MKQRYIQALINKGYSADFPDKPYMLIRKQGDTCYIIMTGNYIVSVEDILDRRRQLDAVYREQGFRYIYHLLILFHPDAMFSEEQIEQVNQIPNMWLFAEDLNRVFQYENQPLEFDGVCALLESVPVQRKKTDVKSRLCNFGVPVFDKANFPYVTVVLVALNVLCYIIPVCLGIHGESLEKGALWGLRIQEYGEWYRIITAMFLHVDSYHIINNMIGLLLLGKLVEEVTGHGAYLGLYMGTGIISHLVCIWTGTYYDKMSVGASAAIYGLIGAIFALRIFFKEKVPGLSLGWMIWMVAASVVESLLAEGVNNLGHISGLVAGFLIVSIVYLYKNIFASSADN